MSRTCPSGASCWLRSTRVNEADDDELSFAFYSANVPTSQVADRPYRREEYARAYHAEAMTLYRRPHINKMVQMVAKAVGANPQSRTTAAASAVLWRVLQMRAGPSRKPTAQAA